MLFRYCSSASIYFCIHLRQIGLQNWGVIELEKLLAHYGHDRYQEGSKFPSFVDVMACKREFLAFKLQATTEWGDKIL